MGHSKQIQARWQEIAEFSGRPPLLSNAIPEQPPETYAPQGDRLRYTDAPFNGTRKTPDTANTVVAPYRDATDSTDRPHKDNPQWTGITLRNTTSSMWSKTRQKISRFTVPLMASPWEHEIPEKEHFSVSLSSTVRDFDHQRQRRRLFINCSFQWLVTAAICASLGGCLYGFSKQSAMTTSQKHIFNAVVTGLSIALGSNLASSLSGYAQMMRWRLLASKYRNLQDFELVMNFDSQMKVVRLLWAGRTRGGFLPNRTQALCFAWLFINIALQVLTALLGLTYSVDTSSTYVNEVNGNVSIADLSYIHNPDFKQTSFTDQAGVANEYGIAGQDFFYYSNKPDNDQTYLNSYYTNTAENVFWHRFIDQSPDDSSETIVSPRTISTTATCESFTVLSGGYITDAPYVVIYNPHFGENFTYWVDPGQTGTGSATYMSNTQPTCGPRCTQIHVLLTADNQTSDVPVPRWFSCNNTVGLVTNTQDYKDSSAYQVQDEQARLLAGAIGWSGFFYSDNNPFEYVRYSPVSAWSPSGNVDATYIASKVMEYTAGAITAIDSFGPRINVMGKYPIQALVVDVEWHWAITILSIILGAQALVLVWILIWANKAIIKDTSHLSTARLLRPVVEKLGDDGCLLTGDEIAERLGNYRLKYGVRSTPDGTAYEGMGGHGIRHLDVIEESEGLGREPLMYNGLYDGMSSWKTKDTTTQGPVKRRTRRSSQ